MSVFRRRSPETPTPQAAPPADEAPTTVPVARDPDLAVPPFRPAAPKQESPSMSLPPKPTMPSPGMGVPPRPAAPMGAAPAAAPIGGARPPVPAPVERRTLVVGKGISLQGTVTDAERLVVEGTVESQMINATELLIAGSGVFKGEVQVEDAEIAGIFDGTLTAKGNLVIRGTGKVIGVARSRRLQVEDGGQLSGRMEMLTDSGKPIAAAPAAPAPSDSPVGSAE